MPFDHRPESSVRFPPYFIKCDAKTVNKHAVVCLNDKLFRGASHQEVGACDTIIHALLSILPYGGFGIYMGTPALFCAISPSNFPCGGMKPRFAAPSLPSFCSASLAISDSQAEEYYKKNKFKFDNVPFEGLKENIKAFLRKKQVDERLREWFEVLKIKYGIRNQLAEKGVA
jgi:hypothetical protein